MRNGYSEPGGIYTGFKDVDIDYTGVDESWRDVMIIKINLSHFNAFYFEPESCTAQ